jgi:catechol 2,3-dioxygenase-like lactoylglutathione lyase family enzyme
LDPLQKSPMSDSSRKPNFEGTRHVGLAAKDPISLVPFYRDVLGMTLVRQTPADSPIGTTIFLSRHPEGKEDHDLVIFPDAMFMHIAFEVSSLSELKRSYQEVKEKVPIKFVFNHGMALSFYFDDPEGHNIEIYWSTIPDYRDRRKLAAARVWAQPIDLDLPEEELLREVKHMNEIMASGKEPESRPDPQQGTSDAQLQWTKEAEAELEDVPLFVRNTAKKNVENYAREHSIAVITPEVARNARKAAGMG